MTISSQICLCVGVCINTLLSKILIYKNFQEKEILMINVFSLLAKDDHYICTSQQTYPVGHGVLFLCTQAYCVHTLLIFCV